MEGGVIGRMDGKRGRRDWKGKPITFSNWAIQIQSNQNLASQQLNMEWAEVIPGHSNMA